MLKQSYRLKRRQDFRRVYQRGNSLKNRAFVLCFRAAGQKYPNQLRIGFSVSKKIGKAVERNRVRRRLREACRLELAAFPKGVDYVLIARLGAKAETVASLQKKLRKMLGNPEAFAAKKPNSKPKTPKIQETPQKPSV